MKSHATENVWYGKAELFPKRPIIAGEIGTWTISYTVGKYGIDVGGQVKIAMRFACDWATPQVNDSNGSDYMSIFTDGDAQLSIDFEWRGYVRPWFRVVKAEVINGCLKEGDEIIITLGDTSGGGPGTRAQTFSETLFEFLILVDCFGTGVFVPLSNSPKTDIIGGPVHHLVVLCNSQVVVGEPFCITVKADDVWGNPSASYSGTVSFDYLESLKGVSRNFTFDISEGGVHHFRDTVLSEEGIHYIRVADKKHAIEARSNPIICNSCKQQYQLFWADLHGQTRSTLGTGTVEEYFRFARDVAALDVCVHQGNDFQITNEAWHEICSYTKAFHKPKQFITFLGYEWSGSTSAGGDHNVIWFEDDQPIYRSSHWQVSDKSDEHLDRYPFSKLLKTLKGNKVLIVPHVGGRRAVFDDFDTELEPVIEICSVHGHFEWFLYEALQKGLKVGVLGNGDDHTCRPGASFPTDIHYAVRGGLTCIIANELTRQGIWEALKARRTYATTGERIFLAVRCEDHYMGEEFVTKRKPVLNVEAVGTNPFYSLEVFRNSKLIFSHPFFSENEYLMSRLRIAWSGARSKTHGRETNWNGSLRIENGRFLSARTFAFDNWRHGLKGVTEDRLSWVSGTSGDLDGLILDIDGTENTKLIFETIPLKFTCTLSQLKNGPIVKNAGGVDQKLEVSFLPANCGPEAVELSYEDINPHQGLNPYYVKLVQENGEMAWSSPLYVYYEP